MDTIPLRPQTPSSQDGLEAESRKAESLPDTSGLLTLLPAWGHQRKSKWGWPSELPCTRIVDSSRGAS